MTANAKTSAREKVLNAAKELFYNKGYFSTTVDQIIEKSGVSKPTVYSHFPTKEDLCVEYLKERRKTESMLMMDKLRRQKSARDKFFAIIDFVRDRSIANNYRGCPFFNMVSELSEFDSPIVREARIFVDGFNEAILEVTREVKASGRKFSKLNDVEIARAYYLIVCGAIMAAQELQQEWPFESAKKQVENLLP